MISEQVFCIFVLFEKNKYSININVSSESNLTKIVLQPDKRKLLYLRLFLANAFFHNILRKSSPTVLVWQLQGHRAQF
jgi:hypothetical protein